MEQNMEVRRQQHSCWIYGYTAHIFPLNHPKCLIGDNQGSIFMLSAVGLSDPSVINPKNPLITERGIPFLREIETVEIGK
ncbi:hypothetical protein MTP99_014421 [Tenebrio molitor]|nr:hypothetical protein MTP99_014421 [Tenebrio molitor]